MVGTFGLDLSGFSLNSGDTLTVTLPDDDYYRQQQNAQNFPNSITGLMRTQASIARDAMRQVLAQQAWNGNSPQWIAFNEYPSSDPLREEVAMFESSKWTGGNDLPKSKDTTLLDRPRPALKSEKAVAAPVEAVASLEKSMAEYADLAAEIGFHNQHIAHDLKVEKFKAFLVQKDWGVFSLPAVISYMDKKAEAEAKSKSGWEWRPLREKDHMAKAKFGKPAYDQGGGYRTPASDFYNGSMEKYNPQTGRNDTKVASSAVYDKLVPIHALKKVAAIMKEYPDPVYFFVCDYAPAPHIFNPDPFLMAVIDNPRLHEGVGRFVIDFWDEPGFGLEQQLA